MSSNLQGLSWTGSPFYLFHQEDQEPGLPALPALPWPQPITQRKDKIQTTPRCSYLSHVQLEYERIKQLRLLLQSGVDRLSSTKFFCMCRLAILDVGYFMFFLFFTELRVVPSGKCQRGELIADNAKTLKGQQRSSVKEWSFSPHPAVKLA